MRVNVHRKSAMLVNECILRNTFINIHTVNYRIKNTQSLCVYMNTCLKTFISR